MRRLRYLNSVLTVIAVLLTINLYTMWTVTPAGSAMAPTSSYAADSGVVDARVQRKEMIDLLKQINSEISAMHSTLSSGKVRVTVENTTSE
ncbi:MAG: hypothetical protein IT445_17670 [Phycisphaeraceae bacterium]|nr:hypothetical protein [Phycisphaeraceae bacterium]